MHEKLQSAKQQRSRLSSTRAGFSLLEIIIVTALMVTIAAMMLPAMANYFSQQKVEKGADRVRTEMGRAQVEAIRTGEVYAFFFRPGYTSYTVAPFNQAFQESQFAIDEENDGVDNRGTDFNFDEERLPRGVYFAQADSPPDARVAQEMAQNEVSLSNMRPILFYPDGTSQNAIIILANERGEKYKIILRGLTGTAKQRPYSDN